MPAAPLACYFTFDTILSGAGMFSYSQRYPIFSRKKALFLSLRDKKRVFCSFQSNPVHRFLPAFSSDGPQSLLPFWLQNHPAKSPIFLRVAACETSVFYNEPTTDWPCPSSYCCQLPIPMFPDIPSVSFYHIRAGFRGFVQ